MPASVFLFKPESRGVLLYIILESKSSPHTMPCSMAIRKLLKKFGFRRISICCKDVRSNSSLLILGSRLFTSSL
jgi:hypothetical protein